ncbi:CoA pyrophosphatase [candidate division KSB1 bacterium]|nr:CoA pyrophosphatase [candidate division KSB1 bacterium]NIR71451.1 CoA pyrophosphatase [candidate division KSB1 bacterium]NIS23372.1 CoA pyrophosphatase [candidate division KSB1 bacterium]NIT70263.1 CoA pyrophosphatase [candidate division KSB1 bacterium]NIU23986.1 CoA pyrophosphatase [candidate division KSB1 bacterium]
MQLTPEIVKDIIENVPKRRTPIDGYVRSAILMLFFNRHNQTYLVYIRRTKDMTLHSGQMAFPGGKIDAEDASSYETAVRETYEEIGVSEDQVVHLGEMGYFETLTSGYDAVAHLAWCDNPPKYRLNPIEVAEVVEIPVAILKQQFRPDLHFDNAQEVMYLNFRFKSEHSPNPANLWGLTARITHHFIHGLTDHLQRRSA